MSNIVYQLGQSLYLNITNQCTNHCDFCIRYKAKIFHQKFQLWLDKEPTKEEILQAIGDPKKYSEIVFCGYGEPLIRLKEVKNISQTLKEKGVFIRIDTNGQANLFHQRNIVPELKGLVDAIWISLNASDAKTYETICHSIFGQRAFPAILEFTKESRKFIPKVYLTAVDLAGIDFDACAQIAKDLDVGFKIRKYYEEVYPGRGNRTD